MGLITALLAKLTGSAVKVKGNAPGQSVVAKAEALEGQVLTPEVYQAPGVYGIPGDGVKGVYLKVGRGGRYGVVVAIQNYQVTIDVGGQGGAAIYSTTPDGKNVRGKIVIKPDGTIEMNGASKNLVTYAELNTALQAFKSSIDLAIAGAITAHTHSGVTTGPGVSGPGTGAAPATSLDISAAKANTLKTGG